MELGLSLGDSSSLKPFVHVIKTHALNVPHPELSFHMGLSLHPNSGDHDHSSQVNIQDISTSPPLLTLGQVNGSLEGGSRKAREFDHVNRGVSVAEEVSSANRTRLFDSESVMYRGNVENKRSLEDHAVEEERGSKSRASTYDDEKGLITRKKLRLSKQQSAFLEESFEQHSALNPKQKHALAEQLNLRPRQVEVWFQNRRARTKLKQTEVDCECLKRCFETLTEENRKLHKELQELRALQTSTPFYMQSPATTLTMCSSCHDRVAVTSTPPSTTAITIAAKPRTAASLTPLPFPLSRSRFYHKSLMMNIKEKRK